MLLKFQKNNESIIKKYINLYIYYNYYMYLAMTLIDSKWS